jgi:N6-adenosine-specific RNA methylase IME4
LDSVIEGQQRQHSRKPDRARTNIERYHPDAFKLELFARETRPDWDAWGLEAGLLDQGAVMTRRWASGRVTDHGPVRS